MSVERGKVFWITGLSGAGKTTIGKELFKLVKEKEKNTVLLDGDEMREVFGNDLGYSKEDRFRCAMRYARICRMLANQGIHVIICTISMFEEVRAWNREEIAGYIEIYVRVPMELLKERNQKELYSECENGSTGNVVGMDLELELPKNPDLIIDNTGESTPEQIVDKIWKKFLQDI